jgi:predicted ATP-dependent serine protease
MPRKPSKGIMSEEQKAKIRAKIIASNNAKRKEQGLPELTVAGVPKRTKEIELVKMRDQKFDPDLFVPFVTGKPIDKLFTNVGGVPKACNFIVVGDPGVGKSTVTLDILSDLSEIENCKCLFVSAEMTRIDLYEYVQRYPKFGNVDILFLNEYDDDNPKLVIEELFKVGYDVILIDSFAEVQSSVREVNQMTSNGSEKWIIDLMVNHNLGENDANKNTTFLCIQQVTKGGTFVGSNKLKHNTTGMMEIRFDEDLSGTAYIFFSKNRRGPVNKKMYFNLKSRDHVEYDGNRFDNDESSREIVENEMKSIRDEESTFDQIVLGDNKYDEDLNKETIERS